MPKPTRIGFDGDVFMINGFSFGHFAKLSVSCREIEYRKRWLSESRNHTGKFSDTHKVGINGYASISVRSDVQMIKRSLKQGPTSETL